MLKKSKVVALLVICVMMFATVEPALAWGNRTGSQTGDAVAYGAGTGAVAAIGAAALIFFTGGLATPLVIGAAAAATAAGAAGGAYYGYNVEEKSLAKDAAVIVGGGVAGAGAVGAGGAAATAGGGAVVEALKSAGVQAVKDNKDNITSNLKAAATTAWQGVSVMGTAYGAYEGVQFLYGLVKPNDDENLKLIKKVDDRIQKLAKEGKKVVLKKIEQPTSKSLTAYYTVDGVEHVETFSNK